MDAFTVKQLNQIASLFVPATEGKHPPSQQNGFRNSVSSDECYAHSVGPSVDSVSHHSDVLKGLGDKVQINGEHRKLVRNSPKRESVERDILQKMDNGIVRRQSFSGRKTGSDTYRKRSSLNSSMMKVLEHPSAFPSILRSSSISQSHTDLGRDGRSTGLRRRESFGSVSLNRKDREGSYSSVLSLNRRDSHSTINRRDSISSAISRSESLDFRSPKSLNGQNDNNHRRQSHGVSLYLRPDSSGQTNLIRRDSFGSQGLRRDSLSSSRHSVLRDYVSKPAEKNGNVDNTTLNNQMPKKETNSILRKNSVKSVSNKHVSYVDLENDKNAVESLAHQLTKANLNKHVTILEKNLKSDAVKKLHLDDEKCSDNSNSSGKDLKLNHHLYILNGSSGRRISIDSLEMRRNSWDRNRRGSSSSTDHEYQERNGYKEINAQNDTNRPRFIAVTSLEDVQAVRCAEFHPNGKVYAVGSNSKTFRICEYPSLSEIREEHTTYQPTVLFKRTKHHKGSIYCMAWSPQGDLVATGSNDKTVKLMRYNDVQKQLEGKEIELTMHDGTVRDLCFLEDSTNKTSLLISAGAGDCKIYVTDCATATPFQALSGHGGHILSLYNWGGAMFVSGSHDKSVRFWDLRTRGCVNTVTPATVPGSRQGSPVATVCVDPSGRLLVSGHEDSSCVLYDIRGNRPIQCFKPHSSDVRSIRFSPSAYYLLTGGYDNKLVLTDLQGDLTMPLPSVIVAQHSDKVISGRWHPNDFSFLSTSADKTATLWALPPI